MPFLPTNKEWYITMDGLIEFTLACVIAILLVLYVDKSIDYHNIVAMREGYDAAFCSMRARVDTISNYIGGLPRL